MSPARRESGWSPFITVTGFVVLMVTWACIPPAVIRSAWLAERAQMQAMVGQREEGVHGRAVEKLRKSLAPDFRRFLADARSMGQGPLGDAGFGHWLEERIMATWWWAGLIAYRLQGLMGWLLPGIPLAMAAYRDGQLVREIRKYAFVAQSPIRHSLGVRILWIALVCLVGWLVVPLPLPWLIPPLLIVAIAYALWLWMSHLQKRL